MATNEILPFASTNTGTNLLTQAEYTADAQRTTGNQPGIARSKLVNKALRQSSLLSAGLAEFIADYQANNVTDSLTAQNIADYLVAAIAAALPVATETLQGKVELATSAETIAGTDSTRAISPANLQTKTANDSRLGLVRLATTAESRAWTNTLVAITPNDYNEASKGTNQNLIANGYQKLPGGLIIQWGKLVGINYAQQTYRITFQVAFPNAFLNGSVSLCQNGYNSDVPSAIVLNTPTATYMDVGVEYYTIQAVGDMFWIAIGY